MIKRYIAIGLAGCVVFLGAGMQEVSATTISVTATVTPGATYIYTPTFTNFAFTEPGRYVLGYITVSLSPPDRPYNGPYPWIIRVVYTGNAKDTRPLLPIKAWCLNFGPEEYSDDFAPPPVEEDEYWNAVWLRVPNLNDPNYIFYQPDTVPGEDNDSELVLVGVDPRNASWVTAANPLGDIQLTDPPRTDSFRVWFAVEIGPTTLADSYIGNIKIEVVEVP